MLDPPALPECPYCGLSLTALIASPPSGGYVVVQKYPIEFVSHWHGSLISTPEGVSRSDDQMHPFQIDGAWWHFRKTLAGSRLGSELLPFDSVEAQLQKNIDATDSFYTIAWTVLRAAQNL